MEAKTADLCYIIAKFVLLAYQITYRYLSAAKTKEVEVVQQALCKQVLADCEGTCARSAKYIGVIISRDNNLC